MCVLAWCLQARRRLHWQQVEHADAAHGAHVLHTHLRPAVRLPQLRHAVDRALLRHLMPVQPDPGLP